MSKCKKDKHNPMSTQAGLFDTELSEGALDVSMAFRDALSRALRGSKDSRWQVAARISELSGREISKHILDKYTSSDEAHEMKCIHLPAFCVITGTFEPIEVLAEAMGCEVVGPEESKMVRLARLEAEIKRLELKKLRLKSELGIK